MLWILLFFCVEYKIISIFVKSENLLEASHLQELQVEDLQKCIQSFKVHKDKIIRTQDSLAIGGKYIIDAEISGRQNCLKLCCETDNCDVFVFEENTPGSCYLFHCGPLHDFKCKFTNHANYSSAVLVTSHNRKIIDQKDDSQRSQQEYELKSLRKLTYSTRKKYVYTKIPRILRFTTETPSDMKTTQITIVCGRNQYKCQNSGDCIAVYNVCDGIPQCADGSDEASELGCLAEKSIAFPAIISDPIAQASDKSKNIEPFHQGVYTDLKAEELYSQQNPSEGITMSAYQLKSIGLKNNFTYFDTIQKDNENSKNQASNRGNYYEDEEEVHNSNHEEPSSMSPFKTQKVYNAAELEEFIYGSLLEDKRNYTRRPDPKAIHTAEKQSVNVVTESSAISLKQAESLSRPAIKKVLKEFAASESNVSIKQKFNEQGTAQSQLIGILEWTNPSQDKEQNKQRNASSIKLKLNESYHQSNDIRYYNLHLRQKKIEFQETYLKPKGAVISLVLGLIVLVTIIGFIVCRLRVLQKRNRRGHNLYAHEAEYLVNGMYL